MITLRPRQKPLVQRFTVYLLPHSIRRGDLDNTPHSRANLILRHGCELVMREHGWLPYESGEPGVGYLLCPGDWVIIYEDGRSRAEEPGRFAERYQPI